MHELIFNVAFLCQILAVSVGLPWLMRNTALGLLDRHPEAEFPRLYPQPRARYETLLNRFLGLNAAACLVGLFFWTVYNLDSTHSDYAGVVWGVFMLQSIPYGYLEVVAFKTWQLMRTTDTRRKRSASLRPRSLGDVISPLQVSTLALVFAAFCGFLYYVDQFQHEWFGGWLNAAILAATYALMLGMVAWQLHTKNRDPYMSEADHVQRVRHMANQFVIVCHALTIYAAITITLQALDLHELKQLTMTLYCQALFLAYYLVIIRRSSVNFEVYRDQGHDLSLQPNTAPLGR